MAKAIAVLGTASDVGKSILTAALCKILYDRGYKVAPFKAQNMSNNSFVTYDGKEIGRAQAFQAFASGLIPDVNMNPILLKPSSESGSQVIVQGNPVKNFSANNYYEMSDWLFRKARESFDTLAKTKDVIIIEGAGSCAEINLKDKDFVNFRMAKYAHADVILVSDIDKGGVFAQIIGTIECLDESEKDMIKGIVINKFRGDLSFFKNGVEFIEKRTGKPVIGVIPFLGGLSLDDEDSLAVDRFVDKSTPEHGKINIAVLKLPFISNFTDFDAFRLEEDVKIHFLSRTKDISIYDVFVIPGSKSVSSDLNWIRKSGWVSSIKKYAEKGGRIVGICGGFQMLGKFILDPLNIESTQYKTSGLGFLDFSSEFYKDKTLSNSQGFWIEGNIPVNGYEIHMGKTKLNNVFPAIKITRKNDRLVNLFDGAKSRSGKIWGSYLHGLFDDYPFRHHFLSFIGNGKFKHPVKKGLKSERDIKISAIASHFEKFLKIDFILELLG